MSVCDAWIKKVEKELPEECCTDDLVKMGIYTSPHAASAARKIGDTPPYFKLGKRIMYPRDGVILWLKEKKHENSPQALAFEIHRLEKKLLELPGMASSCRT